MTARPKTAQGASGLPSDRASRRSDPAMLWLNGPGSVTRAREFISLYAGVHVDDELGRDEAFDLAEQRLRDAQGRGRNEALTLMWAAGSMRSPEAASVMVAEVENYLDGLRRDDRDRPWISRLLARWQSWATDVGAVSRVPEPSTRRRGLRGLPRNELDMSSLLDRAGIPADLDAPIPVAPAVPVPAAPAAAAEAAPGVVVVRCIGDARSPDGAAMAQRYSAVIGRALPAKGAVPAEGAAREAILSRWPWATRVADHVEGELMVLRNAGAERPRLRPMLLVGPPGGGKTSLGRALGEILGAPSKVVGAAGSGDSGGLAAMARGWSTAKPCAPVLVAIESMACNPVIVVDELDKSVGMTGRNGSVAGTILGMLGDDPSRYMDPCLMSEVDLSWMTFVATANDFRAIPDAVRDRFEAIPVGRPSEEHLDVVVRNLRAREAASLGVAPEMLPWLDEGEMAALRARFVETGCSLRVLDRAHRLMLSAAAKREAQMRAAPGRLN